jgi:hypothetical protein
MMSDPVWLADIYTYLAEAPAKEATPAEIYEHPHLHLTAGNPHRNQPGVWWRVCEHCGFEQKQVNTPYSILPLPAVMHKCRRDEKDIYVYWREY